MDPGGSSLSRPSEPKRLFISSSSLSSSVQQPPPPQNTAPKPPPTHHQPRLKQTMALVRGPTLDIHMPALAGQCRPYPAAADAKPKPSLPSGHPRVLESPLAWDGAELAADSHVYHLSDADVQDLEGGMEQFKAKELDGHLVNSASFPLKHLGERLRELCHAVHNGRGFVLIRGLDPAKYSVEDGMTMFLAIQSYVAEQRGRQDSKGNMVVHIVSDPPSVQASAASSTRALHARYSTSSISFHTEETGDILAWQTRGQAASGGKCIIASAYTIYKTLAATRPDIITTLARPDWPFALPYFHYRPVIFYHNSRLIINFGRAALLGNPAHPRPADLPSLTACQLEALDVVESIAASTQFEFATQPGDIHFVNNLALMHRRDEFVDSEADGRKRHLVRMRLRNAELSWGVPPELKPFWDEAFGPEGDMAWHIEPMPEGYFPLRAFPN